MSLVYLCSLYHRLAAGITSVPRLISCRSHTTNWLRWATFLGGFQEAVALPYHPLVFQERFAVDRINLTDLDVQKRRRSDGVPFTSCRLSGLNNTILRLPTKRLAVAALVNQQALSFRMAEQKSQFHTCESANLAAHQRLVCPCLISSGSRCAYRTY